MCMPRFMTPVNLLEQAPSSLACLVLQLDSVLSNIMELNTGKLHTVFNYTDKFNCCNHMSHMVRFTANVLLYLHCVEKAILVSNYHPID